MIKPNGYDEVNAGGDWTPINTGGHTAVIKSIKEQISSTGKDMIVVAIDFDKKDEQAGYFAELFENDTRDDKKWPFQAIQYITTTDASGKCNRSFKGFVTSFENSNNTEVDWDAKDFCKQFKGKKIGVVYGEVEEEYNGETKMRRRIRWFCEYGKAKDQNTPDVKYLNTAASIQKPTSSADSDGFMAADAIDEDVPF